jgi:hypothetical protein
VSVAQRLLGVISLVAVALVALALVSRFVGALLQQLDQEAAREDELTDWAHSGISTLD